MQRGNTRVTKVNNFAEPADSVLRSCPRLLLNPASTPLCKPPSATGNLRGSVRVSWQAHSYDMETMGGSNEEHMLLCFNRAAHCARKGILYSYSDSSQWKPEPSLSQLSLQYPSVSFSPRSFFPPLFLTLILHAFILLIVLMLHVLSCRLKNNCVQNSKRVKGSRVTQSRHESSRN